MEYRRRFHGGDGGDRRHGQKVVGAMPLGLSHPHENFAIHVAVVHSRKLQYKLRMCHYESEKLALISA